MTGKVLLIDDDEGFLLAVSHLLESAGHTVSTAHSAAEARAALTSARPDLILLDVIMPGDDGFTYAQELSDDTNLADIPVVLVTAVAENPGHMMRAFAEGKGCTVVDILPKSVVHDDLLDVAAKALAAGGRKS